MPPLRIWAPRDRLEAPALNANFSLVAAGAMPGALCPVGADVSIGSPNTNWDLLVTQPAEGDDLGGYWKAEGFLIVPQGLGGLHVLTFGIAGLLGAAKGNCLRITVNGWGVASVVVPLWASGVAGHTPSIVISIANLAADFATPSFTVASDVATTVRLGPVRIIRLASFGLYK